MFQLRKPWPLSFCTGRVITEPARRHIISLQFLRASADFSAGCFSPTSSVCACRRSCIRKRMFGIRPPRSRRPKPGISSSKVIASFWLGSKVIAATVVSVSFHFGEDPWED